MQQERRVFAQMRVKRARLDRIAYPVLKANADICSKTRPDIGALTHTEKMYSKKLRPAARRELGAGVTPTVMYIRRGSPADKAGLRLGDRIETRDGKPLNIPGKAFQKYVEQGETFVRVRGGQSKPVSFEPETICGYSVRLRMSSAINAFATGRSIIMTSGMMEFAESDEEIAMIVGHELAHNEKQHIRKTIQNLSLTLFSTRFTRPFEAEADYVGLYYAARAGFSLENVEDIWRRLARMSARPIVHAKTHPTYPNRVLAISATRDEIEMKRKSGQPLLPNSRD